MAGEKKKKRIFEFSLLRRVFQYAAPYKGRLYWSVCLAILLAILSPLRPWLIQLTINDYIREGSVPVLSIKEKWEITPKGSDLDGRLRVLGLRDGNGH
jgi:ATP-binding cassette subfamily B protein